MKFIIIVVVLLGIASRTYADKPMTQMHMEDVIRSMSTEHSGQPGVLQFSYGGVQLMCISDVKHNRMRIVAPIGDYSSVSSQQKDLMFAANFHTALDARYALSEGVLFAAFIHPLTTLDEAELRSAVIQVASLVQTFGTSYSSSALSFGGTSEPEEEKTETPL